MYNFFVNENQKLNDKYVITGTDFNHIKNVLRMTVGDTFLVSENGISNLCEIECFDNESVVAKIIEENYNDTNLPIKIYLFQGLPKGDKMELIIQKTVELGVEGIIPVEMNRCVVKLDDKKKKSKVSRWQTISESAAKQSKRNTIPEIFDVLTYKQAMEKAKEMDLFLVPYESKNGMEDTKTALSQIKSGMSVGILIGPEGGFDEKEVEQAFENGGKVVSLGKRILRTETAAITSVSMCMLYAEMNLSD
ncbi:MAG: 16S rRNA (uracil(1498)-N(3))-methyltransferase [Clostridia bacterium]|nr:16S rRNA (uracil(1498)-N(3))-methyltransferase [Clostridia bacterium]MBQ4644379.1 16S rRNA (uracil(1498)-N(3))-methyltransferase [Clostridia bacterium]MBR2953075.1 16S rRNA (uracil(1498)-N(3))-methyltransferase [Clostridia bacterium]